jgi:hypothetical protein
MAKRKSGAEQMIGGAARLPWWVCVVLAVVSFFACHAFAHPPHRTTDMGEAGRSGYLYAFASVGQYALPLILLFGAIASAVGARRQGKDSREELACPSCGGRMLRRTARRGANAGGAFWGCARYPDCKGTRDITSPD